MNEVFSGVPEAFDYWWLVVPLIIFFVLKDWWRIYIVDKHIDSLEWVLLELNIPKENLRSIKAMDQVVAALHGTYTYGLRPSEIWIEGKVEDWMSLEMVGFADGVHFYIRSLKKYRKLVEAAVFSQFPDSEIFEVEDYVNRIKDKPFENKDVFATDFKFVKDDVYPIRTYEYFEDNQEENRMDPIGVITEIMSRLEANEALWIQLLIQPTGTEWVEDGERKISELMGREDKSKSKSVLSEVARDIGDVLKSLPTAPITAPEFGSGENGKEAKIEFKLRSPAEDSAMKAITNKMSKPAFNSILRFVYIDDRDEFTGENVTSVLGAFRQYSDQNLNSLRPNLATLTKKSQVGKINKAKRLAERKKKMVINYINREMPRPVTFPFTKELKLKTFILNTEEVASLFHMPTDFVKSKKTQTIQSKRGESPTDLPTKERN
ncbi:hypothetical protein KKH05_00880 [Patescibacteria group bacterium]|nr:hypothetical protein [Patescibacteria group bacterium]